MLSRRHALSLVVVLTFLLGAPPRAAAQPRVEIGGTLANVLVNLEGSNDVILGIPSTGFGLFNPGVYASLFIGPKVAVEPQLGLVWASVEGDSIHLVTAAAQVDYFFSGLERRTLYGFGSVGLTDVSGESTQPKSMSAGIGVRTPVGDRLTFRVDGRYIHFTDDGGNALSFSVSIGGVFGR